MTTSSNNRTLMIVLVIAVVVIGAIYVLNMPDRRSGGEKIGDAIDSVSEGRGIKDAARQLEDRTPGEKLGDAASDVKDDVKNAVQ